METTEKEKVGVHSLTHNISKVEGHAEVPRWVFGRVISKSIIHTDLHKPNNKLVNVRLEHF
jgi:hypothetical protein